MAQGYAEPIRPWTSKASAPPQDHCPSHACLRLSGAIRAGIRRGIASITPMDISYARELGYKVKSLAIETPGR
jgi:hypothetical protein